MQLQNYKIFHQLQNTNYYDSIILYVATQNVSLVHFKLIPAGLFAAWHLVFNTTSACLLTLTNCKQCFMLRFPMKNYTSPNDFFTTAGCLSYYTDARPTTKPAMRSF